MRNLVARLAAEKLNNAEWDYQANTSQCSDAEKADNWLNSNFKTTAEEVLKYLTNEDYLEVLKYVEEVTLENVVKDVADWVSSYLAADSLGDRVTYKANDFNLPNAWVINEDVTFKAQL